ncbi:MAG: hypothetical protein CL930_13245 [Deltaproteobacteria bacterium]|nr:hypothetical protein [Deltaproteobacteria bacterium]
MIRLFLVWALLGSTAMARQGCPDVRSTAYLAQQISLADVAFSKMDEEAFRKARWASQRGVACLGEPVQPGQAAAYYRMEALGSFLDGNHAQTVGFFKSMLQVAPNYMLPEGLAPNGHPLRVNFEVAQGTVPMVGDPVARPMEGVIRIDGKVALELPKDRPYVFQHLDGEGRVQISAVVGIGVEPPRYTMGRGMQTAGQVRRNTSATVSRAKRSGPAISVNVPLASIAAVTAAVSGVTYAVAASNETRFWDPTTADSELKSLRDRTNTLVWVSAGAATVSVTTGVAAFVVGEF